MAGEDQEGNTNGTRSPGRAVAESSVPPLSAPRKTGWSAAQKVVALVVGLLVLGVVLLMVLVAGCLITRGIVRAEEHRYSRAQNEVAMLRTALDQFRLDTGRHPTSTEGLRVLSELPLGPDASQWKGPYVRQLTVDDVWGNPYVYVCPGVHNVDSYDVESYGKDGRGGGEGYDRDIQNWTDRDDTAVVEASASRRRQRMIWSKE